MQFFSVLLMAASVAAVALPGNDWNQWSSSKCPEAQTVYKTEYKTEYQTAYKTETDYKTEYKTETDYKTEYQTKTETQYATITKECEKQQQTWGNWGGKGQ